MQACRGMRQHARQLSRLHSRGNAPHSWAVAAPARAHSSSSRHPLAALASGPAGSGQPAAPQAPPTPQQSTAPPAAAAAPPPAGADPIFYSAYPLDRAAHLRQDAAALSRLLAHPAARLLPLSGARVLVRDGRQQEQQQQQQQQQQAQLSLAWLAPASDALPSLDPDVPPLFLGLDAAGAPHFGGQVARAAGDAVAEGVPGSRWAVARTAGPALSASDAALAATACGLAQWHAANLHHGATGERTGGAEGGFARGVPSTGRSIYPRIDPAIITLVTAGDWALLGRKAEWPAGRYSTLAGFLEVGETLEQALVREVEEESGVRAAIDSVRYVASQPWPFPRSLMVGFTAQAAAAWGGGGGGAAGLDLLQGPARAAALGFGIRPHEIDSALLPISRLPAPVPQPGEMEDVRWFHRDWLRAAAAGSNSSLNSDSDSDLNTNGGGGGAPVHGAGPGAGVDFRGFEVPGPYSLAHRLITGWLREEARPWAGDTLPQVSIASGTFKYVLMRVYDPAAPDSNTSAAAGLPAGAAAPAPRSKLLVWGHPAADYHNHIYQRAKAAAAREGLKCDVLGGGRIEHYPEQKVISVYGYSAAFGPAPHEVSAALLRRWFPLYGDAGVTVSYDGY